MAVISRVAEQVYTLVSCVLQNIHVRVWPEFLVLDLCKDKVLFLVRVSSSGRGGEMISPCG